MNNTDGLPPSSDSTPKPGESKGLSMTPFVPSDAEDEYRKQFAEFKRKEAVEQEHLARDDSYGSTPKGIKYLSKSVWESMMKVAERQRRDYFMARMSKLPEDKSAEVYEKHQHLLPIVFPTDRAWYLAHGFAPGLVLDRNAFAHVARDEQGKITYVDGEPYTQTVFVEPVPDETMARLRQRQEDDKAEGKPVSPLKIPKALTRKGQPHVFVFLPEGCPTLEDVPTNTVCLIVESPTKAMIAHMARKGIISIGIMGAAGWGSKKLNISLLPILDKLGPFHVVIVPDSDLDTNAFVKENTHLLAHRLLVNVKPQSVSIAHLPNTGTGETQGLDDVIHEVGNAFMDVLIGLNPDLVKRFTGDTMPALTARVEAVAIYIKDTVSVLDRQSGIVRTVAKAKEHWTDINEIGPKNVLTNGVAHWMTQPSRTQADRFDYKYEGPEIFERDGKTYANTYRRSGLWPEGEFSGISDDNPFFQAAAIALGTEANQQTYYSYGHFTKFADLRSVTYLVMLSIQKGVGKGWLMKVLMNLVGFNHTAVDITPKTFTGDFNEELYGKRLGLVQDLNRGQGDQKLFRQGVDTLTGDGLLSINMKGMPHFQTESFMNLVFGTNDESSLPSNGVGDRRINLLNMDQSEYGPKWTKPEDAARWDKAHGILKMGSLDNARWMNEVVSYFYHLPDRGHVLIPTSQRIWLPESVPRVNYASWRPAATNERTEVLVEGLPYKEKRITLFKLLAEKYADEKWIYSAAQVFEAIGLPHLSSKEKTRLMEFSGWFSGGNIKLGWNEKRAECRVGNTQKNAWFFNQDGVLVDGKQITAVEAGRNMDKPIPVEMLNRINDELGKPDHDYSKF